MRMLSKTDSEEPMFIMPNMDRPDPKRP